MKHRFLLDVMVLYFAIKEEREGEVPDLTCARLVQRIGENCHRIVANTELRRRYESHLSELFSEPRFQVRTALFLADIVHNAAKFVVEAAEAPALPQGLTPGMPHEDDYVVRAALISWPVIVTSERRLLDWINRNSAALGLEAIDPAEALARALDR